MAGPPVVIVEKGGFPVNPVNAFAPVLTVAENGRGAPITITPLGAPFIVQGMWSPASLSPLFWAGSFDPASGRMWQDSEGMTPATKFGQPVGRLLSSVGAIAALQATALSRPTTVRWPKGGRRNLLTYSSDISNSSWSKVNGSVSGARFTPSTASDTQYRLDKTPTSSAGPQTLSVAAKPAGYRWVSLRIGSVGAVFDTQDGVVGISVPGVSPSIFPLSGGGFLCVVSVESASAGGVVRINVEPSNTIAAQWAGDGVSGVEIMYAQLEQGMTRTPYQAVASSDDVTEAGVPDVWHLYNNGGDSLPAVLPSGSYEIAWVTHLGAVSYASVTSDGTSGTDLLRAERMADVLIREGTFTSTEKTAIAAYWSQRYAA